MPTKELKRFVTVNWKDESTTMRKTRPSESELAPTELVAEMSLSINVPEVDVPSISAEFDVSEARISRIVSEQIAADENEEEPRWYPAVETAIDQLGLEADLDALVGRALHESEVQIYDIDSMRDYLANVKADHADMGDGEIRTDGGRSRCSNCGSILPREIDEGTGVYCDNCGLGQLVTDGGRTRPFNPEDLEVADVVVDLAQGRPMQIVEKFDGTAADWSEQNNYELGENYANSRFRYDPNDAVFECVYVSNIKNEPSKTYAFPVSRLRRIEVDSAESRLHRPADEVRIEMLAEMMFRAMILTAGEASRFTPEDVEYPAQLARESGVLSEDLVSEARELAEIAFKSFKDSQTNNDAELGDF